LISDGCRVAASPIGARASSEKSRPQRRIYGALSDAFDEIGDETNASQARALAEHHDQCARHERELAEQAILYR
jgi:hypothetical protein